MTIIDNLLKEFSRSYIEESALPYRATDRSVIVTSEIPKILKNKLDLGDTYKVYGSVGKGNWSEIPWIAILDKSICETTTKEYYIVLLFDKNIENIYLCLSVGWTQFKKEFGTEEGRYKIREVCNYYANNLKTKSESFITGRVYLGAKNELGRGYEEGAIIHKKYKISEIRDEELLIDILQLLDVYSELKENVGDSILNIDVGEVEEAEILNYKRKVAEATFEDSINTALEELMKIADKRPPIIRERLIKEIVRNNKFAEYVKQRAKYICQICGRRPFLQKNGKYYAEAHHILPLGGRGPDNPDNMKCICAQCHAVVTHGLDSEVIKLLAHNV
jgi:5-methylcytosine-specific restriction enzyme A